MNKRLIDGFKTAVIPFLIVLCIVINMKKLLATTMIHLNVDE